MAATVNVLCPNGRRQSVKVSPNTRILEIIDTVCQKQRYNADNYNLKHQRTVLDVQVPFRYANLPNNAKLELVESDKPRNQSGSTVVALQLQSGERLQHSFESTISLWELLQHWEGQGDRPSLTCPPAGSDVMLHPVCIYMREEIIGEAWLKATTLKSLGLTGGKAIIRLLHRDVELPPPPKPTPAKTDTNTSAASTPAATPTSQMVSAAVPASDAPSTQPTSENRDIAPTNKQAQTNLITEVPPVAAGANTPSSNQPAPLANASNLTMDCFTHDDGEESPMDVDSTNVKSEKGQTDSQICEGQQSAIVRPGDQRTEDKPVRPKEKTLGGNEMNIGASTSTAEGGSADSERAEHVMQSIESSAGLTLDEYARRRIQNLLEKEEEMVQSMQTALMESLADQTRGARSQPQRSEVMPPLQPFANFKFPESASAHPAGKKKGKTNSGQGHVKPCERKQLVFSSDQELLLKHGPEEVPDEFFDVTMDDVRRMLSALRHQSSEGEKGLETRAMREAREQLQMRKYDKVVVRVHFPERVILQGFFRPQETVEAVKEFVKANLADEQQQFYLYTTPPKTILSDTSQTLFKAKLFPAAVVYFGTQDPKDHYLHEDMLGDLATPMQAESMVAQNMNTGSQRASSSNPSKAATSGASTSSGGASGSTSNDLLGQGSVKRQASPSSGSAVGSTKVPKWFKVGKK